MVGSTLMVWVLILLAGLVALILIGITNCYVPKEQKEQVKIIAKRIERHEGDCTIELRQHINGAHMITIALVVGFLALTTFIMENHELIAMFIQRNNGLNSFIIIMIFLLIVGMAILFLIVVPFALEEIFASNTIRYYRNKYLVDVIDKRYTF